MGSVLLACAVLVMVAAVSQAAGEADALFAPPGYLTMDNWFARDGDTYHAFYLQTPGCISRPNDWSLRPYYFQIGHATSRDLVHWSDCGPAVVNEPGTWRTTLATGSVMRAMDRWWMVFTCNAGIGLAVSDDLMTWKVSEGNPIVPRDEYKSRWQGRNIRWRI